MARKPFCSCGVACTKPQLDRIRTAATSAGT